MKTERVTAVAADEPAKLQQQAKPEQNSSNTAAELKIKNNNDRPNQSSRREDHRAGQCNGQGRVEAGHATKQRNSNGRNNGRR